MFFLFQKFRIRSVYYESTLSPNVPEPIVHEVEGLVTRRVVTETVRPRPTVRLPQESPTKGNVLEFLQI